MTISAIAADGTVMQFPDDTPDHVINFTMEKHAINAGTTDVQSGPHYDTWWTNSPVGRVLDAFGEGAKAGWGRSSQALWGPVAREMGLFNDLEKADYSVVKSFNEALIRPSIQAVQTLFMGAPALIGGAAEAAKQIGKETGFEELGRVVGAIPEVLPALTGVTFAPGGLTSAAQLPAQIRAARSARVIGPDGEKGWKEVVPPSAQEFVKREEGPAPGSPTLENLQPVEGARTSRLTMEEPALAEPLRTTAEPTPEPTIPAEPLPPRTPFVDESGKFALDRIVTADDVTNAIVDGRRADMLGQVETLSQVSQLADALGVHAREITKIGDVATVDSAVRLLIQSADQLKTASEAIPKGKLPATMPEIIKFMEETERHQQIIDNVLGRSHEPLPVEAMKPPPAAAAGAPTPTLTQTQQRIQQQIQNRIQQQMQQLAAGVQGLQTPQQVSNFLQNVLRPTVPPGRGVPPAGPGAPGAGAAGRPAPPLQPNVAGAFDKIYEYWVNAILSNPITQSGYAIGNTMLSLLVPVELAGAAVVGLGARAIGRDRGTYLGESARAIYALDRAFKEGVAASVRTALTRLPVQLPGQPPQPWVLAQKAIGGKLGTVFRYSNTLGFDAPNSFFLTINYRMGISSLAYREAVNTGFSLTQPGAFFREVARLEQHPTPAMMAEVWPMAYENALMGEAGRLGKAAGRMVDVEFLGGRWLRFIAPFTHIGSALWQTGLGQRSPLALATMLDRDSTIGQNLKGVNGAAARNLQITRIGTGVAVIGAVSSYVMSGDITGPGPSDPREAAMWRATGKKPFSFKPPWSDTYISYANWGPFGPLIGTIAGAAEAYKAYTEDEHEKVAGILLATVSKALIDATWMRGPADLMEVMRSHDEGKLNSLVNSFATSFIPFSGLLGGVAKELDDNQREIKTLSDYAQAKLPWFGRNELLPQLDLYGDPIPQVHGPFQASPVNDDPVTQALNSAGAWPGKPSRTIRGVELTPEQYQLYKEQSGMLIKLRLNALVGVRGFEDVPPAIRREKMMEIINDSREKAQKVVLAQHPEVATRSAEQKTDEMLGAKHKTKVQQE